MIRIFIGDDRVSAQKEINEIIGKNYEVFEGGEIDALSLSSIFLGTSLFSSRRRILIKDFSENKDVFRLFVEKIEDFLKTDSDVILWESRFDKRTAAYKELKKFDIEFKEFKLQAKIDTRLVFSIYDKALTDGDRALKELRKIESDQDPYMFFGLLVSQALKKFEWKIGGAKEKRVLKELSRLDVSMKTTGIDPWILIEGFLIRLSSM